MSNIDLVLLGLIKQKSHEEDSVVAEAAFAKLHES